MSIYKACDIRGKFGLDLHVEHARRLAQAIRHFKGPASVLVAGDGRLSTPDLKQALIESLLEAGCGVVDVGQSPTPMFYFARQQLGLEIGVIVTASHNPPGDNGFKVTLGPLPITEAEMTSLANWMENPTASYTTSNPGGYAKVDLRAQYLTSLAAHIPDLHGMPVVIDCANGMAGMFARDLWQQTGAQVTLLLEEIDGRFPVHAPNPAEAKNIAFLQEQVLRHSAGLGIAYDGDADRVMFVDERGQPITGDQAIVLFAREVLRDGPQTIIYDQKCSRIVPDAIRAAGGVALMERSGHTYIKRSFLTNQAPYAGELSGHHFLRSAGGDDALAASLLFARLVKADGRPLSQIIAGMPAYPITPDLRIPMPTGLIEQLLERLESALRDEATITHLDGLRIEYPDAWGLVRPSVTEPVITLRFEGIHEQALHQLIQRVEAVVPEIRGKLVDPWAKPTNG